MWAVSHNGALYSSSRQFMLAQLHFNNNIKVSQTVTNSHKRLQMVTNGRKQSQIVANGPRQS